MTSAIEKTKAAVAVATHPKTIQELIQASSKELGKALPEHMNPERLVRIALTCIRLNPALAECTPQSFLGALFTAAQLGIEPVAGLAYLLPFTNNRKIGGEWKKVKEVQFVLGYKGGATLFFRHEKAVQLSWGVVREHDDFSYEYGTSARLSHRPAAKDRGKVEGYYVIAELKHGGKPFMYMSEAECLEHAAKHSKTFGMPSSPWTTNKESMCLKTVLIQLSKILPLSVELHRALVADESSREYRAGIDDALDLPDNTEWPAEDNAAKVEAQKESPAPIKKTAVDIKIHEHKKLLGDAIYYRLLGDFGVEHMNELKPLDRELFLKKLQDESQAKKRENAE